MTMSTTSEPMNSPNVVVSIGTHNSDADAIVLQSTHLTSIPLQASACPTLNKYPNSGAMTPTYYPTTVSGPTQPYECPTNPPYYVSPLLQSTSAECETQTRKRNSPSNKVESSDVIKEEFLKFCRDTTIRGVPRIVKTSQRHIRLFWLFFVCTLFAGLFICTSLLWMQFREYNVIHPPRVLRDVRTSHFPAFTFCNLRPISRAGREWLKANGLRNPREFGASLNHYGTQTLYHRKRKDDYQLLTSAISVGGYLESIQPEAFTHLGHDLNSSVISCQVMYLDGSRRLSEYCHKVGTWSLLTHAQYLNCFTFNLEETKRLTTTSLQLYIYLNEDLNSTDCIDCFFPEIRSQLSGCLITIHWTETYPDLNQESITVQPGTLTEIKLRTIENIQKEPPYGRCSPATPKFIHLHDHAYAYSEHACRMLTIQEDVNQQCHCNAIEFPYINSSLPFCSSLPSFVHNETCTVSSELDPRCEDEMNTSLWRIHCKTQVMMNYTGDVVESCNLPCKFYSYEGDRSTSAWPTKSFQLDWISIKTLSRLRERPEMAPYREAVRLQAQNQRQKALEILRSTDVLEKNLLAIHINRPNFNVHKVEEKEVLSLTSFLSQCGGLFSIWVGLTMISIVELLEFFINCVTAMRQIKESINKTSASDDRTATPMETIPEKAPFLKAPFASEVPLVYNNMVPRRGAASSKTDSQNGLVPYDEMVNHHDD